MKVLAKFLNARELKKIIRFVGPRTLVLFLAGGVLGVGLFAVELGFAFALQSFLITIHLVQPDMVHVPKWYPQGSLISVLAFLTGLGIVRAAISAGQNYATNRVTDEYMFLQRSRVLTWAFNDRTASSGETTALYSDVAVSSAQVLTCLQGLAVQGTAALLIFISLVKIDSRLSAILVVTLGALALLLSWIDKSASRLGAYIAELTFPFQRHLMKSFRNILLLEIYGTTKSEEKSAQHHLREMFTAHEKYYRVASLKYSLPQIVGMLLIASIALLGVNLLGITPSLLLAYIYLFVRFVNSLATFSQTSSGVRFHWKFLQEMIRWWSQHEKWLQSSRTSESQDPANEEFPATINGPVGFSIRNLSFEYDAAEQNHRLFNRFNLEVTPGSCLVVTGPSGSGKSTLISLLIGLLVPTEGSVECLTASGERFRVTDRHRTFLAELGYVGPDSFMIEGSVRDNLIYGLTRKPSDSELLEAVTTAECHFIFERPESLDYRLTESGVGLSAGQKQRLALARALLRRPKVLILDEATSNLDPKVESKLVDILARLKKTMTIIAITHRHELLRIADKHVQLEERLEIPRSGVAPFESVL